MTRQELVEGMAARGQPLSAAEADAIVRAADTDGDGAMDRLELQVSFLLYVPYLQFLLLLLLRRLSVGPSVCSNKLACLRVHVQLIGHARATICR